jgi:hypothetical protein
VNPNQFDAGHYLDEDVQLHIPTYQRTYEWGSERWLGLWRDIAHQYRLSRRGRPPSPQHFMGCLIVFPTTAPPDSGASAVYVVDGQQRLLTLLVLLAVLRDHDAYLRGQKKIQVINELTTIKTKYGKPIERIHVRRQNIAAILSILGGEFLTEIPEIHVNSPLARAYRFFRFQLWRGTTTILGNTVELPPRPSRRRGAPSPGSYEPWQKPTAGNKAIDIPRLHTVITKGLRFLEIGLAPEDEEAAVIFETMNSKSTPLQQFDLLRNSVFVRMPRTRDAFYASTWEPLETALAKVSYRSLRSAPEEQFFYEYMISRGPWKPAEPIRIAGDNLHRLFMDEVISNIGYAVTRESENKFQIRFAQPLARAGFLYPIAVGQTTLARVGNADFKVSDSLARLIAEIMTISGGPPVPLILRALIECHSGKLTETEAAEILTDAESFLVRLMLSGEPLSPMRAMFMQLMGSLMKPLSRESVRAGLVASGWKTDREVVQAVDRVRLGGGAYSSGSVFPILRGIERQLSGISAHPMPFGNERDHFSIEHIYPQGDTIGKAWTADLLTWKVPKDEMDARRYSLGNLTAVTKWDNQKNAQKGFVVKRSLIEKTAKLRIHESMTGTKWTPRAIDKRSRLLASVAVKRWPRP